MKILSIETSCDETAAAVIEKDDGDIKILSNVVASQIDIHKKYGGVYPEIASRAHTEKIILVIEEALIKAESLPLSETGDPNASSSLGWLGRSEANGVNRGRLNNIDIIAVTAGPGLIGSLLVGVNTAKTLAFANNLPIIPINHWLGHIYSCFSPSVLNSQFPVSNQLKNSQTEKLTENCELKIENLPQFPLLALIVSGGHTGLVLMKSHTEIETIGQTLDDAAGEAFDKVSKILGLGYPGGPAIAEATAEYQNCHPEPLGEGSKILHCVQNDTINIKFPRSMLDRPDFDFSFSGLKTAALYKVKELTEIYHLKPETYFAAVAAEFQQCVIDILIAKTLKAAEKFHPKSILLCGGVSANKELREQMGNAIKNFDAHISYHIPNFDLTTDNAAMIGIAAAYQIANDIQPTTFENINADSNLKLG